MTRQCKCYLVFLLILMAMIAPTGILIASDISDAEWKGTVRATNNGTTATQVSTICSINTTALITNGYLNATATDAALRYGGVDVPFMPGYGNNPWCLYVDAIGASQNLDYLLYTGNVSGGLIRYTPGAVGMATLDDATIEPADNYTSEHSGYFDTTAVGANISSKGAVYPCAAERIWIESSGNISAAFGLHDDFTSDNWTDVGTKISVNTTAGRIDYEAEQTAVDNRTYLDAGIASDSKWRMDFTWRPTTMANGVAYLMLTDVPGNANGFATDWIGLKVGPTAVVRIQQDSNAGALTSSNTCAVANANTYYGRLQRNTTTNVTLAIYTDAAMTTHTTGSPITLATSAAVNNLRYIQVSNYDDNSGAALEQIGWFDDIKLNYAQVNVSGVSSGEHTVTGEYSSGSRIWATGDVLDFSDVANSQINYGAIYNSIPEIWVSLWIRSDVDIDAASPLAYYFAKRTASSNTFSLRSQSGRFYLYCRHTGSIWFSLQSAINNFPAGTAHHIVVSTDNVNGARMRIDGVLYTDAITPAPTISTGGNFVFGTYQAGIGGDSFSGDMFNIAMGTDELTPAEELALYNTGTIPADATIVSYVDEGTGATINNYGTSGYTGTIGAANTWETATYSGGSTGRLTQLALGIDGEKLGINYTNIATVPDNSANWTDCQAAVMPYVEYVKRYKDGVLAQHIEWEYNDTTFTDLSGNGNDAYPSFRTTSSDADVSASLVSFEPVTESEVSSFAVASAYSVLTGTPGTPSGMYDDSDHSRIPGADAVNAALTEADVPQAMWWFPFLFLGFCVVGLMVYSATTSVMTSYYTTRGIKTGIKSGQIDGSLLMMALTIEALLILFAKMGPIPYWPAWLFVIPALAVILSKKHYAWG